MKKTLIAIILVICVCVPAFASQRVFVYPAVGVSTGVAFGKNGVSFDGVGVSANVNVSGDSGYMFAAKAAFKYSFEDASRTGVYIDLGAAYGILASIGVGVDLHMIDGQVAWNMSAVISGGIDIVWGRLGDYLRFEGLPGLTFRYVFLNNTDIPAITLDFDALVWFLNERSFK